jgi:O-antigen/teichoic acid export membrane protein
LILSSTLLVVYSYLNAVFIGENQFSGQYLHIISLDFILSLIINSILNIYLILKIGIIGAPIATSITIIFKIILNYYGIKRLRFKNKNARTTENN